MRRIKLLPGQSEYRTGCNWFMIERQIDGCYWLFFFGGYKTGADSYVSEAAAKAYADTISKP